MNRVPVILIVEDEPHISRLVAILLEEAGYRSIAAGTATEALGSLDRDRPDLVILDWMLPDMPGDQVCRAIKQRTDGTFLPVLMLTARNEIADRVAGLNAGAEDYLTKPFNGDELLARVRALLRIRSAELARDETLAELARQHEELKLAYERLSSTQAQLVQTSKLAALGELVAGVAHELNNPLAIILGNAELLPAMSDEDDRRSVRQIIDAAQRSRRVLQSLVTFARHGQVEAEWHDPRDLVERALDLKRTAFQLSEIAVDVDYAADLPMLWGDGPQIQNVLLSLLNNAEQALASRERPRIVIQVSSCVGPVEPPATLDELARPRGQAAGARMVVFDVADNGPGLAAWVRDRLFEPYVTTRPFGQGAGMGLAIAYGIAQQHRGTLQVASEPQRGVTFRMALPVDHRSGRPEAAPAAASEAPRGQVMVIDDEPAILELVRRLLVRGGYSVVGLQRAREALDELSRRAYDTILCDVRMPDIDGLAFYERLRELRLDRMPRLIVMTGDTSSPLIEEALRRHSLPILRKPFTQQELLAAVTKPSELDL